MGESIAKWQVRADVLVKLGLTLEFYAQPDVEFTSWSYRRVHQTTAILVWLLRTGPHPCILPVSPGVDETQRVPGSPAPANSPFAFCSGSREGKGEVRTLEAQEVLQWSGCPWTMGLYPAPSLLLFGASS